jgi:hypothetical protein
VKGGQWGLYLEFEDTDWVRYVHGRIVIQICAWQYDRFTPIRTYENTLCAEGAYHTYVSDHIAGNTVKVDV